MTIRIGFAERPSVEGHPFEFHILNIALVVGAEQAALAIERYRIAAADMQSNAKHPAVGVENLPSEATWSKIHLDSAAAQRDFLGALQRDFKRG